MPKFDALEQERAILFTTQIRFLPYMQQYKEAALDKIIAQILYSANPRALSIREIEDEVSNASGGYTIQRHAIERSLQRIAREMKVSLQDLGSWSEYLLSDDSLKLVTQLEEEAEIRIQKVLAKLLENTLFNSSDYEEPFLFCLALIFSRLGEKTAHLLTNIYNANDYPSIEEAVHEVKQHFPKVDTLVVEKIVIEFFQSNDPAFAEIKWNLAQNYYLAKAIGLDSSGMLLSRQIFEHAVFYLDTNIVIPALEPKHRHHRSFVALANACKHLNVTLRVCQISLDEMNGWLDYQRELLNSGLIQQIPDELAAKVNWLFFEIYHEREMAGDTISDVNELFLSFSDYYSKLSDTYQIEVEDDDWFDKAANDRSVKLMADRLQNDFFQKREREKPRKTALHDSMLLHWIQKQKEHNHPKIWLITSDTTLPRSLSSLGNTPNVTITLDALLQWISPSITAGNGDSNFSNIFADMIRNRLLPRDRFLQPEDFRIFADMDMECRFLPAEDVLSCIENIQNQAPNLDPSKPEDREKLSHIVIKHFADPSRKFNQEIENYLVLTDLVEKLMLAGSRHEQVLQPTMAVEFVVEFVKRRETGWIRPCLCARAVGQKVM